MERELTLPLPDGKTLYYVHTKAEVPNRKVIVHIHGLASDLYGVPQTVMAQQFPAQDYDVVRPYLYHWLDGTRKLHQTTIAISTADVELLIDRLAQDYEQIFICGHSYGGPMVMSLQQERLAAVSLWDPTYVPAVCHEPGWLEQRGDVNLFKGYFYFLMDKPMVAEGQAWQLEQSRKLAAIWQRPIQVVHAANGLWVKYEGGESFHSNANGPTDYRVIDGTTHCFVEGETTQQLLTAVKDWFDRF